ncbi:HAD-IIB family hydrolase [Bacillus sp. Cr_A10]|uniref:HAD-IIB family hydrolase n=1 Tax=Bacillus sp. Cr_A10 TaxID=3033993 RepID=UPI0023D987D9|nr:HAD-IIB family hydrolase [Bacillus sp. Cr_A10]MDF2066177.1 HAD-IIB family hydrolase [Bacillus sp. Cr_A10]
MRIKPYMLATDLDGTLVGDPSALQRLLQHYENSNIEVELVYITGRHFASVSSLIEIENLPNPDILITDVGAAIYTSEKLTEDTTWEKKMHTNWHPERIIKLASFFPALQRQTLPSTKRISFTVDQNEEVVKQFEKALVEENIPHKLIFSSNRDVDILPENSGKGEALNYILQNYANEGVKVLIAGDSGNDMDMLALGHPSVIVGNAQLELVQMKNHPYLYRATEHFAGGIYEAWLHFYK